MARRQQSSCASGQPEINTPEPSKKNDAAFHAGHSSSRKLQHDEASLMFCYVVVPNIQHLYERPAAHAN